LRASLLDPPIVSPDESNLPAPQSESEPPLSASLLGTILEPGHNLALFAVPLSPIQVKGVGETVGDDHSGVEREKVVLRYRGELITLDIKPSAIESDPAAVPQAAAEAAQGSDDLKATDESTAMDESTAVVGSTAVEK
jgi:hypothetical protein